jgi:acetyl esterase/lipase
MPNLEIWRHDIGSEPLPERAFDLVHARLVLQHVPARDAALARLAASLKHGGWLVIEDFDSRPGIRSEPELDPVDVPLKTHPILTRLTAAHGVDLAYARCLPARMRELGIVDIGAEGRAFRWEGGSPGATLVRAGLEQLRGPILATGEVNRADFEADLALLGDPTLAFPSPRCGLFGVGDRDRWAHFTWRSPAVESGGNRMTSVEPTTTRSELNPALFKPEAIDPETLAFNARLATRLAEIPARGSQSVAAMREAQAAGRGLLGPIVLGDMAVNRTIPGPAGPMTIRTFIPDTVNGVYLHLHGGGWVLGGAHMQDDQLEATALGAQLAVVSLEYRLAPEHPYPAAPDDCEAAALWLTEHAQSEFGSTRLLIGGPSAGAHLAVVTLLRLRDRHQLHSFSRANLVFGAYDLAMTPSAQHASDTLVLSTRILEWHIAQFGVANKECDRTSRRCGRTCAICLRRCSRSGL